MVYTAQGDIDSDLLWAQAASFISRAFSISAETNDDGRVLMLARDALALAPDSAVAHALYAVGLSRHNGRSVPLDQAVTHFTTAVSLLSARLSAMLRAGPRW